MKWSLIALLAFASVAEAQLPRQIVKPLPLQLVAPLPKQAVEAKEQRKEPYIVFVGVPARSVQQGIAVFRDDSFDGDPTPRICLRIDGKARDFYPDSSNESLLPRVAEMQRRAVSLPAAPFKRKARAGEVLPTADGEPWFSREENEEVVAMWPKGLAFPNRLKFYQLEPLYQNMWSESSVAQWRADPLEDGSAQFAVSGGMAGLRGWRSIKGLELKDSIEVWEEDTDVRAFVLTQRWRWRFPVGARAYDVLVHGDRIFEIRMQERDEEEWVTKIIYKNPDAVPEGYHGAGQACASCHSMAGKVVPVDGRIYRHTIWGDDGRFSWRPFKKDGKLDKRWPIELR